MKNLYNITIGQLITLWVFGVFAWLYTLDSGSGYDSSSTFFFVFIPFVLVFYSIGWWSHRKQG